MAAADGDLDAAEHPGLGIGEHAGAEGVPAAQVPPGPGCSGTPVATASSGRSSRLRSTAWAAGPGAASGPNGPVLANATTPVPGLGGEQQGGVEALPDPIVAQGQVPPAWPRKNARPMPGIRGSGW